MIEIIYSSTVRRDQKRIIDWFAADDAVDTALRFIDAMDATANFIAEFPDIGNPWESSNPRHAGLRFRLVKGFEKYVMFYRRFEDHVQIMRVLHGSQDIEAELSG